MTVHLIINYPSIHVTVTEVKIFVARVMVACFPTRSQPTKTQNRQWSSPKRFIWWITLICQNLQQLDSFSSGNATPKNLKENLMIQMIKPAKAPKGLSLWSLGISKLEDSAKHKESDLSQQIGNLSGSSVQSNKVEGGASNLSKSLMGSGAWQEAGNFSFDRPSVDSFTDKKQPSTISSRNSPISTSRGKAPLIYPGKNQPQNTTDLAGKAAAGIATGASIHTYIRINKTESSCYKGE